jgi:pimeloyl-ACP methyl ester carboxylesterase
MGVDTPDEHAAAVARIESLGRRLVVPCAAGAMVWRAWGEGRPLVLLHGASGSWTHWIRNVLPLAARRRVLAADMPGFGDSDGPPPPHTAEGLADLVVSGIDALVPPPGSLDVAGFSFGAIIASLVAARLGSRVGTLALLGPGGFGLAPPATRPLSRVHPDMAADAVRRAHRENLAILMIGDAGKVDDLAVHLQIENIRRSRFRSGDIPASDVLRRALPAIRARVATAWGERDAFMGPHVPECRRILAAAHPGLDVRLIAGAGHWICYEAADEVNAALLGLFSPTR